MKTKSAVNLVLSVALLSLVARMSSQKETVATERTQVVEFKESEVPYMLVSKKKGKTVVEIVDNSGKTISQ